MTAVVIIPESRSCLAEIGLLADHLRFVEGIVALREAKRGQLARVEGRVLASLNRRDALPDSCCAFFGGCVFIRAAGGLRLGGKDVEAQPKLIRVQIEISLRQLIVACSVRRPLVDDKSRDVLAVFGRADIIAGWRVVVHIAPSLLGRVAIRTRRTAPGQIGDWKIIALLNLSRRGSISWERRSSDDSRPGCAADLAVVEASYYSRGGRCCRLCRCRDGAGADDASQRGDWCRRRVINAAAAAAAGGSCSRQCLICDLQPHDADTPQNMACSRGRCWRNDLERGEAARIRTNMTDGDAGQHDQAPEPTHHAIC